MRHVPASLDPRTHWLPFLVVAGAVLSCAFVLINPVSASTLLPVPRTVFWALHVYPALALLQLAQMALMRLPVYAKGGMWLWVCLSGVVGAALFTPWALWLDALFGMDVVDPSDTDAEEGLWSEFTNIAPILVVVWLALNGGRMLRLSPATSAANRHVSRPAPRPLGISAKLPPERSGDIIALSAELHYTRVFTPQGSDLVLYPFGTAVSEQPPDVGRQVHRSHWVNLAHVTGVERVGQRAICHLTGGVAIPVSRSNRAALEAALATTPSTRA